MTINGRTVPSRRAFLNGLGIGLGLLPLLSSDRAARAQAAVPRKRFISVTWCNGVIPQDFYPPAGPLTQVLPPVLSPLEPWKSKVLALRGSGSGNATGGVDVTTMVDQGRAYDGHNSYPALLSGAGLGTGFPSIDTLIGQQLQAGGFTSPRLNLGCRPYMTGTSWSANGVKNTPETDPRRVYSRLFGGPTTPVPPALLLARRKSIIDFSVADLARFRGTLGREDRVAIDAHLDSLRALELRMGPTPITTPACQAVALPPAGTSFTPVANYPLHVKLMVDMIAAAVRCDLARVFTLDLIDGGGNSLVFPWLGIDSPDYSSIAHTGTAARAQKTAIDTWFYAQVADLVKQLADVSEAGATALDNSVILVSNGMNVGGDDAVTGLPYLVVGSGAGFFKQGTCVQFAANVPNNRLLASVCHAMDLNVASVGMTYPGDLDSSLRA